VAAVGSYADARAHGGAWLVRIEDLDPLREAAGASDDILRTLEAFGFAWDGALLYQHTRREAYEAALEHIRRLELTFPCGCSRRDVARTGRPGPEGPVYPGTCRSGVPAGRRPRSIRVRSEPPPIALCDRIQGRLVQDLPREVGDFVIRRADGIHAYQLAVVVDDAFQGINQVVRGADLLSSTPRQILLQRYLGLPTPAYAHLPLALDETGRKMSKSSAAAPVDPGAPLPALLRAWAFLGQTAFAEPPANPEEFWEQAFAAWGAHRVPARGRSRLTSPARPDRLVDGRGCRP
jgi:glutamyl-Q tRNA(Asp) synthetase